VCEGDGHDSRRGVRDEQRAARQELERDLSDEGRQHRERGDPDRPPGGSRRADQRDGQQDEQRGIEAGQPSIDVDLGLERDH